MHGGKEESQELGKNEAGAASDADVLVTFGGPVSSRQYFGVQFYLEDLLGRPVDLVTRAALDMALGWRAPPAGLVHHSDRGSQYAAHKYRRALEERGITVSMSGKGDCWDNAPMESANATVKVECVHGEEFATRAEAAMTLVEFFGYYNTERLHSSLGYETPSALEQRWFAANRGEAGNAV